MTKSKPQQERDLTENEFKHIEEWLYWGGDVLKQVQTFYESDCGYNGRCKHVWVPLPMEDEQLKLPMIENKFKYALVVASTRREAISTQRIQLLDEVKEVVEGMKKVGTEIQERQWCKCGNLPQSKYCDNCRRKVVFKTAHRFTNDEYTHNQALDDLLQAINKLEEEHENKNLS